jgi:hypothetical protein
MVRSALGIADNPGRSRPCRAEYCACYSLVIDQPLTTMCSSQECRAKCGSRSECQQSARDCACAARHSPPYREKRRSPDMTRHGERRCKRDGRSHRAGGVSARGLPLWQDRTTPSCCHRRALLFQHNFLSSVTERRFWITTHHIAISLSLRKPDRLIVAIPRRWAH